MPNGEFVRGNFGRKTGEPARADTVRLPNLAEDDSTREERVRQAAQDITRHQSLIDSEGLTAGNKRAHEDSIVNILGLLSTDEQEEVLSLIDQMRIRELKE